VSAGLVQRAGKALLPWAFPLAVIAAWEAASQAGIITPRLLPAPSAVAIAFWENARSGVLLHHMAISAGRALYGLLIGGVIGFALGVLNGVSRPAETNSGG
jgi:sulfonate transport system permease protein